MSFINPKKSGAYILTARGTSIKNDGSNIGHKLLTKMGWTSEVGLGKNGTGIIDPIKATSNFGTKGFGTGKFESSTGMSQQAAFSNVLSSLSKHRANTSVRSKTRLEDKSEKSRSRVHYGKFVRAKDVSQYSDEQLKIILGSSHADIKSCDSASIDNKFETENSETKSLKNEFGVKTYSSSTNLHEYFTMKKRIRGAGTPESSGKKRSRSSTSNVEEGISVCFNRDSLRPSPPIDIKQEGLAAQNVQISVEAEQENDSSDAIRDDSIPTQSNQNAGIGEKSPTPYHESIVFKNSNLRDLPGYPFY